MTQSWFRMNPGGRVDGVSDSDRQTAEMNLSSGQYLLPHDPSVNPLTDVWDEGGGRWIHGAVTPPRLEDDPVYMRRTGYPALAEQVAVLMKIAHHTLAGDPVPQGVRDEFSVISADISAVKAAHAKPKTQPA